MFQTAVYLEFQVPLKKAERQTRSQLFILQDVEVKGSIPPQHSTTEAEAHLPLSDTS